MFIEFIDLLRCPRDHEETWLVAAFNKMSGRYVKQGTLGCPVCHATYEIRNRVADLRTDPAELMLEYRPRKIPTTEETMRLAALLNLTRPGSLVILQSDYADAAQPIAELTQSRVIGMNVFSDFDDSELTSAVLADTRLPFATASADGIALIANEFRSADIARVLKPGGRVILPADALIPAEMTELARDEACIVAESTGPLIGLTGKSRR